ncbi:MAG: hypothetical protein EP332_02190 [Bacteroidetes bacterium]|nr:MAG: hypothetical protein EP332_02190 [Bacteroidota bacterium]
MSANLKYTLVYILTGSLWIILTDSFVETDPSHTPWQTLKGLFYVLATGVLVYYLLYRASQKIQKEKQEILHRENVVYRVVEYAGQDYCLLNQDGLILFRRGELAQKRAQKLDEYLDQFNCAAQDAEHLKSLFNRCLTEGEELEREISSSGKIIRFTFLPIPAQSEVVLVAHDLTNLKQEERSTGVVKEFLNLITNSKDIGYWHWSIPENKTSSSDSLARIIGVERAEDVPVNTEWISRIHPDDLEEVNKSYARHLNGETDSHEGQYRFRVCDNTYRWLVEYARVTERNENGEPQQIMGVIIDFQTQKDFEEKLKERQSLLNEMAISNSHQVRGPLARILGLVSLYQMMKMYENTTLEEVEEILEKIQLSACELDQAIGIMAERLKENT